MTSTDTPAWRMSYGDDPPEELGLLLKTIRTFLTKELWPLEQEAMSQGLAAVPRDQLEPLRKKAKAAGMWCFGTPAEWGGLGLGPMEMALVLEEASRHTFSLPDAGDGLFGYDPPNILLGASEEQRQRYLPSAVENGEQWFMGISEPTGGSDPARAIRTRAERHSDGWILNGRKMWTSRIDQAEHGVLFARTSQDGREGITAFIIDLPAEGLSWRQIDVIRDHHTNEVLLEDVFVPESHLLGEVGKGFQLAQRWLNQGRLKIATQSVGAAQLALEMACEFVPKRETFGAPLSTRQGIQWMLADCDVELRAARGLILHAAGLLAAGKDPRHETSVAKLYATEAAYRAVDRTLQVHGGIGLTRDLPYEHWLRALRVNRIVEGASEVQRMVIARNLLTPR
jgi:acyl-CoA dehydrogenase